MSGFSVTNTTPLMVTSVGQPIRVAGYAKQAISNGASGKYGYLGQYFDKAYKVGTNGMASSTETGLLSEYGEFFPTESGQTALVTMTNWGVNERGTGMVHVISLSTDANHDGIIDTSFHGPDFTTYSRPFRFWVNDDNDSGDTGGDDIPKKPALFHTTPNGLDNHVNGVRDLVDFFPVYLDIKSLLQAYPSNSLTVWLKHSEGALNFADTSFYQDSNLTSTNCLAYLTDTNIAFTIGRISPSSVPIYQITSVGTLLDSEFVNRIRNGSGGIILVEARAGTTEPLVLDVYSGTNLIAETSLYLSITDVEQMFRQKNLIRETFAGSNDGFKDRIADSDVLNEPETNDKSFLFVHGYNVNPNDARGTFAETFKRMFWSGSHAKFYGVTWKGSESQIGPITKNYHTNVANAFLSETNFAIFVNNLTNGPTVAAAHSLGNMLVLAALNDASANVDKFFMVNAAVASEAIDGGTISNTNMVHSDWDGYTNRVYASQWFRLFGSGDGRSNLTWSNRLANFGSTEVFNFYSSGEEVLRTFTTRPTPSFFGYGADALWQAFWNGVPVKSYVWCLQELGKGTSPFNTVLGSTHGGWGFNSFYTTFVDGVAFHISATDAAALPLSQLQTNPVFNASYDGTLFGTSGSTYAQTYKNRILGDAIPALTLPVGANSVTNLNARFGANHNFNMQTDFESGWPASRTGSEALKWHHSDFKEVAYTYTYGLFDTFVTLGGLK